MKWQKIEKAQRSMSKHKNRWNSRMKKAAFKLLNKGIKHIGIEDYAMVTGRD